MIATNAFKTALKVFLAPVVELLEDPAVSEIMINGPSQVWVERRGKVTLSSCAFSSADELDAALRNIAQFSGRPFTLEQPILEAHLPDGSRVEAVMPPLAEDGPVVAIRRFVSSALTLEQLVALGTLTDELTEFLAQSVIERKNIVVSGGTGSGKTSLLGALSSLVPDDERLIVIEDTREVQLQKPHVVYLETRSADERGRGRVTIRDLLRATLRLRPDRIVVGEVRGGEALDLVQAMTSGHGGAMTTAHADSSRDAVRRLETMAMMGELGMPLRALRAQVASAVDLVVQVRREADGRRRVSEVGGVRGISPKGGYLVERLFTLGAGGGLRRLARERCAVNGAKDR